MRGIKQEDFAKFLQESFVSVWVDYESGFGTFPIESMISNTPVIGKAPALKPEWISDENGIWTYEFNEIVDILANFIQNWLEDNISDQLYENMQKTAEKYTSQVAFDESVLNVFNEYFEVRGKMFEEQLEKIKITEEK
jgi:glycosyltransferase involved in cell wall biosynthesis